MKVWWSSFLENCLMGGKAESIKPLHKKKKKRKRKEKGQLLLSFSTLVLQSSTMFFIVESLMFSHFHILVRIFVIELGLCIATMGFLKCPRSSWASKLDAHPLVSFVELSFIFSSSASVAWQPYSLTLISIDGHLHSPLIRLVDVRLSPSFCLLHNHLYSTHSAISMAHAHVLHESWKVWKDRV